jgi:hypothetical protein
MKQVFWCQQPYLKAEDFSRYREQTRSFNASYITSDSAREYLKSRGVFRLKSRGVFRLKSRGVFRLKTPLGIKIFKNPFRVMSLDIKHACLSCKFDDKIIKKVLGSDGLMLHSVHARYSILLRKL